jgi:hypothetical protein
MQATVSPAGGVGAGMSLLTTTGAPGGGGGRTEARCPDLLPPNPTVCVHQRSLARWRGPFTCCWLTIAPVES